MDLAIKVLFRRKIRKIFCLMKTKSNKEENTHKHPERDHIVETNLELHRDKSWASSSEDLRNVSGNRRQLKLY